MKKNSIFEKYKFQNFLANIIPTVPILLGSLKKSQPIRSCRLVCYMEHIYKCLIIQAVLYHIFTKYLQYFSFFSTVYIKKLIIHGKLNFSFPVFLPSFFYKLMIFLDYICTVINLKFLPNNIFWSTTAKSSTNLQILMSFPVILLVK